MELNAEEARQVLLLLQSSRSAMLRLQHIRTTRALGSAELEAIGLFENIRMRLENNKRKTRDLPLKLLFSRGNKQADDLIESLVSLLSPKPTLLAFGMTPWHVIITTIEARGLTCPLALQIFHEEFEKAIASR